MPETDGPKIFFDNSAKAFILELLDKEVDEEGAVVEKGNPEQKVITSDGNELFFEDFGGIKKGSEIFIEDNTVSLFRLSKDLK